MDLQSIISQDGAHLRHEAGTNGGELAGPCPFCGGKDRFRVWPEKGRYWCRQCGARGDAIQYLRDKHGMSFREACEAVGRECSSPAGQKEAKPSKPPADEWLTVEWQKAAWEFLGDARRSLQWNEAERKYLRGRGLNDETIFGLGWNGSTAHMEPGAWGLPDGKKVWLPRGIVIPAIDGGLVHRLRIRLAPDEFERTKAWTNGKGIKYAEIPGSGSDPLLLPGKGDAWVIVESELDAYLVSQEAGNLVNVLGLGSTTGKPTAHTLRAMAGKRVLLCLDHDGPGWKATEHLPGKYWPTPEGKDPGEYFQTGGSIRSWIEVGLKPDPLDDPKEIVQSEPLQAAEEPVCDDDAGAIEEDKGLSLPCGNPKFRCYHLRGGQCQNRQNWGPVSGLEACPMIEGAGTGYAHPEVRRLERQRAEHGLDPELSWIYGGTKCAD